MRICGQEFSLGILDRIRDAVAAEPQISRRTLSRRVCQWLDWRSASGDWQEGGCRKALAELDRHHVLELAAPRTTFAPRQPPALEVAETKVCAPLEELGAVELIPIGAHRSPEAQVWRVLMQRHHYLGDKRLCGAQLRYLIRSEHYGWLGALAFSSASWALRDRDRYIGWDEPARRENLPQVVANARFLIVPGVEVANLASYVLGAAARCLPEHWAARYGVRPVLLETFVDPMSGVNYLVRSATIILAG